MERQRQGRAEVVEPSLAVSAAPRAPARPPAAALRPERRELQSESASSSWGQQCHSVQGSEGQTRVPACPPGRWSVPTCPFTPPESSFRCDTKCRGRAWHRLLLQLPQMTALFSTTKPYITHWSCYFGQILADSPPKNLRCLPLTTEGRPHSSAESSELENQALHPVSPIFHSPLTQSTPR